MKEGQCSLFTTKLILMRLEYSLHWKIEKNGHYPSHDLATSSHEPLFTLGQCCYLLNTVQVSIDIFHECCYRVRRQAQHLKELLAEVTRSSVWQQPFFLFSNVLRQNYRGKILMRFLKFRQGWTPLSSREEIPLSCTCVGFILCLCLILTSSLQLSSNAAVVSPGVRGLRTTRTLQCFGHLHAQMTQLILLQAHMEHLESHLFTSVSTCLPAGSL